MSDTPEETTPEEATVEPVGPRYVLDEQGNPELDANGQPIVEDGADPD